MQLIVRCFMNTRLPLLLAAVLLVASLATAAPTEVLRSVCTAPTLVSMPWNRAAATPKVFLRSANGKWQPADFKLQDDRIVFHLDPAALGSASATLLINPPAGLVMDDYAAPVVSALKVDGKPAAAKATVDLGNTVQTPRTIAVAFTDALNLIALDSARVQLDGEKFKNFTIKRDGIKSAVIRVQFDELDYGKHELAVSVADVSPQWNRGEFKAVFNRPDTSNFALASAGATVTVDASFPGYESLEPLNDGVTPAPSDHCGNDISWASAETATDHWAQITLPKPTEIREVSVYWAAYSNDFYTPNHFQIQIPDGDNWKTIYSSPKVGEKPATVTTARFAPVTVQKFRVFMPRGEGAASRPNLLWIEEIKAR